MPIGTPAYMSPEQAAGEIHRISRRTDVYALGTILYELLTGNAAVKGETVPEMLHQVRYGDPIPPRRLVRKVPRELEIICLKCLHKNPDKHYGTALELAEDLRRFADGLPILARPVGRVERLIRWGQRRPAAAMLLALLPILLTAGVAAGAAYFVRTRTEKGRADRSYTRARDAITRLTNCLEQTPNGNVEVRTSLQARLAQEALTFFEAAAAEENGDDPRLRLDRARAYYQAGLLEASFNRAEAGLDSFTGRGAYRRSGRHCEYPGLPTGMSANSQISRRRPYGDAQIRSR